MAVSRTEETESECIASALKRKDPEFISRLGSRYHYRLLRYLVYLTSRRVGEEVTWEAKHLGIRQRLTSRITAFEEPVHFRDSQVSGAFRRFDHDHFFRVEPGGTVMEDRFDYESPLGLLGRLADVLFLRAYMTRFLERRTEVIREVAERG